MDRGARDDAAEGSEGRRGTVIQQVIVCAPQLAGLTWAGDAEAGTAQGKMTWGLAPPEACLVAWTVRVTVWAPGGAAEAAA